MNFSDAIKEIEELLAHQNIGKYIISEAETKAEGEVRVHIFEPAAAPDDEYFYTINPDGRILNMYGEDVVKICRDAYSNEPEEIRFLDYFENKWIKNKSSSENITVKIPGGYLKIEKKGTEYEYPGVYVSSFINDCEEILSCTEYDTTREELITCCYIEGADEPVSIFRHKDGEELK